MNLGLLLRRVLNSQTNVDFADFVRLIEGHGFILDRTSGSHHIYRHPGRRLRLNVQPVRGQAKPYQVRQFLDLIERNNITIEGK